MKTNKANTAVQISHRMELVGFLRSIGAECRFVTLTTETPVDMVKKHRVTKQPNPFLGTIKVARRNGLVNIDYVASVERKMEAAGIKDAEYVAGTTWYVHEQTTDGKAIALCVHQKKRDQFYLQYFPMRNLETRYVLNGRDLTEPEVKLLQSYLAAQSENEFKPRVITLAIDSIRSITFRKIEMLNKTFSRLVNHLASLKNESVSVTEDLSELASVLETELGPVGEFVEGE